MRRGTRRRGRDDGRLVGARRLAAAGLLLAVAALVGCAGAGTGGGAKTTWADGGAGQAGAGDRAARTAVDRAMREFQRGTRLAAVSFERCAFLAGMLGRRPRGPESGAGARDCWQSLGRRFARSTARLRRVLADRRAGLGERCALPVRRLEADVDGLVAAARELAREAESTTTPRRSLLGIDRAGVALGRTLDAVQACVAA
jgi:hypothetical protein